jgi:phosphoribosyl-AMP cyclohydrolase
MSTDATDALIAAAKFDANGLVAAIAQQHDTKEVLMLAWMNRESLRETLATGRAVYYSRSRQELWRKGDTSGHTQRVIDLRLDCDGDAVLLLVDQAGAACHTGQRSCFFTAIRDGALASVGLPA